MRKTSKKFAVAAVLRVYWAHIRRYPIPIFFAVLLSISAQTFNTLVPLWYKQIIDIAAANPVPNDAAAQAMYALLTAAVGLIFIRMFSRRSGGFLNTYFQPKVIRDLGETAFSYLIDHSYRFFANNFTGSLVRRVTRLQRSFEEFADRIMFDFIPIIVTLSGAGTVLFLRNTLLGWLFLGWVVVFFIVQFAILRWKLRYNLKVSEKDSEATGALSDAISNDVTIKTFAGENHERSIFERVSDELARLRFKSWSIDEVVNVIQAFLMIGIEFLLFFGTIHLWRLGLATVGDFILVQAYVILAVDRLWDLGNAMRKLYESFADASEMVEILNTPHEIVDRPNASLLSVSNGTVEFRNVGFRFHAERSILDSLNLSMPGHEKLALVGPSGAGKTTITKLILRFYEVSDGGIFIDGQNIAEVTQESLRNAIAFVPQEPILFHRTLMENIRYGRRDATDEEVIEAARQSHCYDFITATPEGFNTFVGERGIKLSGGERQRVAIARAILKDAPILILDEATSSLDSESEALIQDALAKLMEGKTVIAIAHRLSTVMKMDRIIVIENGKVATVGTHDELVRHEGGLYKKLWEIQAGGFIQNDIGAEA